MNKFQKLSLVAAVAALSFGTSSCTKKNTEVETDYNAKKASAQTLIDQIDKSTPTMMTEHDQWMKALNDAAAKPGADTAKINSLKNDMNQHMADGTAIKALEDSVKAYMNATPDQGDAFKNADDRLGSNFNDLDSKWKSFQDKHASLGKSISDLAVTTSGDAAKTEADKKEAAKNNAPAKTAPVKKAPAPAKEGSKPAPKPEDKHEQHGSPRVPVH
jgi:hypothetical protein